MTHIIRISKEGRFVIPVDIREKLGIQPGTRIAVRLQGTQIILEPVSERLVNETRGILAVGTSLSNS